MPEYPPKLIQVTPTTYGSLLRLSDGSYAQISITPGRLSESLVSYGQSSLDELVLRQSLKVYTNPWTTLADDWRRITTVLLASPVARNQLGEVPSLWENLAKPVSDVCDLPQRVYGGLEQALFLSHPFHFHPDRNRDGNWLRCLLNASGGRLFQTWVEPSSAIVEIDFGVQPGHFVEE